MHTRCAPHNAGRPNLPVLHLSPTPNPENATPGASAADSPVHDTTSPPTTIFLVTLYTQPLVFTFVRLKNQKGRSCTLVQASPSQIPELR